MFRTRRDQVTGKMCDIPGETTPEYVLSPDDVGRVVGVRCTPTNDKDECGLPATDVVNNGSPIEISDEVKKEITNLASKGTVTYHTQLVKFGKSSIPTQVTVTLDKKMVTVTKKKGAAEDEGRRCPEVREGRESRCWKSEF